LPGGGVPSCIGQKKALEKAKARLQYAQDKFDATKRWGAVAAREASEYTGRSNQLASVFDAELPQAILVLDRVLRTLEAYQALRAPTGGTTPTSTAAVGSVGTQSSVRPEPAAGGQNAAAAGESTPNQQASADASEHTKSNAAVAGNPSVVPGSSQP